MYIAQLTDFFSAVEQDDRLTVSHISLYMALFELWNVNQFENPIAVTRRKIMKSCKIYSFSTYHKIISDLQNFGYIKYLPSFHPAKGSLVYLLSLYRKSTTTKKQIVG